MRPKYRNKIFFNAGVLRPVYLLLTLLWATSIVWSQKTSDPEYVDKFNDLKQWVIEQQPGGKVFIKNKKMEIDDAAGCTIWFKHKLQAPCEISYRARVIDKGGPTDRVSDLNCFWLAKDLNHPDDFFFNAEKRVGRFPNYHDLRLYYVGLGGHNNTKTRFRRYDGTGDRPLLPGHDLADEKTLIKANKTNRIKIVVDGNSIRYYFNNILVYDFVDPEPYREGYFGIRTVENHMWVDDFRVRKISH